MTPLTSNNIINSAKKRVMNAFLVGSSNNLKHYNIRNGSLFKTVVFKTM